MNTSLATWMKLAVTALIIGALLFDKLYPLLEDVSNDVGTYITSHQ